jgi:hypothetical protein
LCIINAASFNTPTIEGAVGFARRSDLATAIDTTAAGEDALSDSTLGPLSPTRATIAHRPCDGPPPRDEWGRRSSVQRAVLIECIESQQHDPTDGANT